MIVAIAGKAGSVPGVRVQRLSDDHWLDPATKEWGDDVPDGIIPARVVAGSFASTPPTGPGPYSDTYTVDVPIEAPDTYLVFIHGPEAEGYPRIDRIPQVVHIPEAQAWQGYAMSPVTFVPGPFPGRAH